MGRLRNRKQVNITVAPKSSKVTTKCIPYLGGFVYKIYTKDLKYLKQGGVTGNKEDYLPFTITSIRILLDGVNSLAKEIIKKYNIEKKQLGDTGDKIPETNTGYLFSLIIKKDDGTYSIRVPYFNSNKDVNAPLTLEQQDQSDELLGVKPFVLEDGQFYNLSLKSTNPFSDRSKYVQLLNIRAESSKPGKLFYLQAKQIKSVPMPRILKSLQYAVPTEVMVKMRKHVAKQLQSGFYLENDDNTNMFQLVTQLATVDSLKRTFEIKEFFRPNNNRQPDNYIYYIRGDSQEYVPKGTYVHLLDYSNEIKESDLVKNNRYTVPSVQYMIDVYNNKMKELEFFGSDSHSMVINNFTFLQKKENPIQNIKKRNLISPETVKQRISFTLNIERGDTLCEFKGNVFEDDTQLLLGISDRRMFESIMTINRPDMIIMFYTDVFQSKQTAWYQSNEHKIISVVQDDDEGFGSLETNSSQSNENEPQLKNGSNPDIELPIKTAACFGNGGPYINEFGLVPCGKDDVHHIFEMVGLMMDVRTLIDVRDGFGSITKAELYFGTDTKKEMIGSFSVAYKNYMKKNENGNLMEFMNKEHSIELRYEQGLINGSINKFNKSENSVIRNLSEIHGMFKHHEDKKNTYRILMGVEDVHRLNELSESIGQKLKNNDLEFYKTLALNHDLTSGKIDSVDAFIIHFNNRKFMRRVFHSILTRIESNGKSLHKTFKMIPKQLMKTLNQLHQRDYDETIKRMTDEQKEKFDLKKFNLDEDTEYEVLSSFRYVIYAIEGFYQPSKKRKVEEPEKTDDKLVDGDKTVTDIVMDEPVLEINEKKKKKKKNTLPITERKKKDGHKKKKKNKE